MTIGRFRFFLVASLVLGLFGALIDFVFPALIPEDFHYAHAQQNQALFTAPLTDILTGMLVILLGMLLVCVYGLYTLRPWAPRLSVGSTLLALVIEVFLGTYALSGLAFLFTNLSSYLWGAVLILANCPPFNARFQGRAE
jgi:hypothetical protein